MQFLADLKKESIDGNPSKNVKKAIKEWSVPKFLKALDDNQMNKLHELICHVPEKVPVKIKSVITQGTEEKEEEPLPGLKFDGQNLGAALQQLLQMSHIHDGDGDEDIAGFIKYLKRRR